MSAQHNMTGREICAVYGMKEDTARQRNNTRLTGKWSLNRVYSDSEISILLEGKPKSEPKEKPKSILAKPENKPENKPEKQEEKKPKSEPKTGAKSDDIVVLILSGLITVLSIALTITGLFVFVNWAGIILGGMFSLFLFATVWIARNKMKGATSERALSTVWKLELGAAVLHCFTFWRLLPEFPDGWFFVARIILCGTLAGFAAYLSYNAVLTVRDYNAET
jgi:cation transport ATPase